ncbi:hypothetical protein XELAEV_18035180mg [Xenopus laevis]|uniref:Uncharacterized protein n=1 Tax=Xenopus laevis TaxID=8355 RepID=A0A974CF58_XENLA|nr:hypothetical protein XELAEV_18035180mg [Xenopus laevis]
MKNSTKHIPQTTGWCNPKLPHLETIRDLQLWASFRIKYVRDILQQSGIVNFDMLKSDFAIPKTMYFRYHAVQAQFLFTTITMSPMRLEELAHSLTFYRPLSTFYAHQGKRLQAAWTP